MLVSSFEGLLSIYQLVSLPILLAKAVVPLNFRHLHPNFVAMVILHLHLSWAGYFSDL